MILKKLTSKKWIVFVLIFTAILFVLAALAVGFFELRYLTAYYPGVTINGQPVGGKTYAKVAQEFQEKSTRVKKNGVKLVFEGKNGISNVTVPAVATGFSSDILVEYFSIEPETQVIADAYTFGHTGPIKQRLKEQFAFFSGKDFTIPTLTHREAIRSLLLRETRRHVTPKTAARFSFENNTVVIITETPGEAFDMEETISTIERHLAEFETQPIVLKLKEELPHATKEKLAPYLPLAQKLATLPGIIFYYKNRTWPVSGKTLTTWLTLKPGNQLSVDRAKLEAFLKISTTRFINNPPQNSRFEVTGGKLQEISPGVPGNGIDIDKTIRLIENAIAKDQLPDNDATAIRIPIETIVTEPQITQKTIDQYQIKDLVGTATTSFTGGSADRQRNIEVGVSKITGMLIAPGEEFSTVDAIGEITEEAGFVKEFVINKNQTVKELGGGLCQLATTLFRTALHAGLPITERVNHKYVIPYYGPGLDATMYEPHPDFRFVNDTQNYILLQGVTKNNKATFELYGVIDGRTAQVSTPILYNEKPVPPPRYIPSLDLPLGKVTCTTATHEGVTADVTYTVKYPDGIVKENVFHSVYEAWPKVCLVGTLPAN